MIDKNVYLSIRNSITKHRLNLVVVRKPPSVPYLWRNIKSKHKGNIICISSNKAFPTKHAYILANSSSWLHCFRDPLQLAYFKGHLELISESDFTELDCIKYASSEKLYDVSYSCYYTQKATKNFNLMMECLPHMRHLRVNLMLHGFPKQNKLMISKAYPNVKITTYKFTRSDFLKELGNSRISMFPNKIDASPRVLTESLCMNMPVLVNSNILGGWKYVNEHTGSFFDGNNFDPKEFSHSLEKCLALADDPSCREWFGDNYGSHATVKLASFVNDHYGYNIKAASFVNSHLYS